MEAKVQIISKELIKPSSPTPHENKHLEPSSLDQFAPFFYIPLVFFFPSNQSYSNVGDLSQLLRQSLSDSLTAFYPLAGKLSGDLPGVDCDDSGALFVEAKFPALLSQAFQWNAPLEKLNQFLPFEPYAIAKDDVLMATYPRSEILLAVQISRFECGSIAIGVCISHKVADFASLVAFMNSWAGKTRAAGKSSDYTPPNFDLGRHVFPPLDSLPDFIRPAVKGKFERKRLLFDREKLAELKRLGSSALVKDPTRVELVTAFLWKHFVNAARANDNNQATAQRLFVATQTVNLRSRMRRRLASSCDEFPFGNLSFLTFASFAASDEEDWEEEEDFRRLVWLSSSAIRKVDEDHVLESAYPFANSLWSRETEGFQDSVAMSHWSFTSWCRSPIYEADFGWGKPVSVCPAGNRYQNGVILMSTRSGDGIEAWIAMQEDIVDLLPDEFFALATNDIFPVD